MVDVLEAGLNSTFMTSGFEVPAALSYERGGIMITVAPFDPTWAIAFPPQTRRSAENPFEIWIFMPSEIHPIFNRVASLGATSFPRLEEPTSTRSGFEILHIASRASVTISALPPLSCSFETKKTEETPDTESFETFSD